jgi:hypothetical protein
MDETRVQEPAEKAAQTSPERKPWSAPYVIVSEAGDAQAGAPNNKDGGGASLSQS